MPIDITTALLTSYGAISGRFVGSSAPIRNADNDITFFVEDTEEEGLLEGIASISGKAHFGSFGYGRSTLSASGSISATYDPPLVLSGLLRASGSIAAAFYTTYHRKNLIGWSKIGDARLLVDSSNEAGFHYFPGFAGGLIHSILGMSDKYPIAYGASGIFLLYPVSEPFATFGYKRLGVQGVLNAGAVCGSDDVHFFIDTQKDIYKVSYAPNSNQPSVVKLGFAEFIQAISPANQQVVMTYDKVRDRVYISSVIGGYVLTNQGLGGGYMNLTGTNGQLFISPVALTVPTMSICTDTLDMHYRGIKTLVEVMVGVDSAAGLELAIDYKYDKASAFATSSWIPLNKEGVAFPIVSAVEFRIRVRGQTHEARKVDYLVVKFKYSDKRYSRSPFNMENRR